MVTAVWIVPDEKVKSVQQTKVDAHQERNVEHLKVRWSQSTTTFFFYWIRSPAFIYKETTAFVTRDYILKDKTLVSLILLGAFLIAQITSKWIFTGHHSAPLSHLLPFCSPKSYLPIKVTKKSVYWKLWFLSTYWQLINFLSTLLYFLPKVQQRRGTQI